MDTPAATAMMIWRRSLGLLLATALALPGCEKPASQRNHDSVSVRSAASRPGPTSKPIATADSDGDDAPSASDLEMYVHLATSYGCSLSPPFWDRSEVKWVVEHFDHALPLLLDIIETGKGGSRGLAMELVAAMDEASAIPVIEDCLWACGELTASDAGQALGIMKSERAFAALIRASASDRKPTYFGATLGLMRRADRRACAALTERMNRPDDPHRYYTVQAAGRISCLDRATLAQMGRSDPDPEIRGLARRILDGQ